MPEEKYLTVKETSKFLKISVSTLNRLVRENGIPSYNAGHRTLFDRDELIEWMGARRDGRSNMGDMKSGKTTCKRRWYDRDAGLSSVLENLRTADKRDRDNMLEGIKRIIAKEDPDLIKWVYTQFPPNPHRERWYDKDPYLWLVVNALHYADDETIKEVVRAINGR